MTAKNITWNITTWFLDQYHDELFDLSPLRVHGAWKETWWKVHSPERTMERCWKLPEPLLERNLYRLVTLSGKCYLHVKKVYMHPVLHTLNEDIFTLLKKKTGSRPWPKYKSNAWKYPPWFTLEFAMLGIFHWFNCTWQTKSSAAFDRSICHGYGFEPGLVVGYFWCHNKIYILFLQQSYSYDGVEAKRIFKRG